MHLTMDIEFLETHKRIKFELKKFHQTHSQKDILCKIKKKNMYVQSIEIEGVALWKYETEAQA